MPEIKNRFQFEPSYRARSSWLSTRKERFFCGPNMFPGFYQTTGYVSDSIWFFGAVMIELTALIMILQAGFIKGGIPLLGSILSVILFITLDIVGIIFNHSKVGELTMLNNRLIFSDSVTRNGIETQIKKNKRSFKIIFGIFALVLSCLLKVASIILLTVLNPAFYVVLTIFYILVVYIHSRHTGYWLAETSTRNAFSSDYNEYAEDLVVIPPIPPDKIRHNARELHSIFESPIELRVPIEAGAHKITYNKSSIHDGQTIFEYTLTSKGILLDSDFVLLVQNQANDIQRDLIGKECLKHQVTDIHFN